MRIYEMKKQNLPAEVLVYKEIGRRILSSKQFKRLRTLKLVVDGGKGAYRGVYYGSRWRFGGKAIQMGTGITKEDTSNGYKEYRIHANLLEDRMIETYIHELGHMAQYNNRQIRIRGRVHNVTFGRLVERLEKNYKKIKPELENIKKECQKVADRFSETKQKREDARKEGKDYRNSINGKLEKTTAGIKNWTTKQRRAETALKKLNRRKKLYEGLLDKKGQ